VRNPVRHSERTPRAGAIARAAGQEDASKTSKKAFTAGAWEEARGIIWTHRKRLALGLGLMLINRLSGFVLPTTTKYLMDDVITQGHWELLPTLGPGRRRRHRRRCLHRVRELTGARRRRASARSRRCARTSRRT
jgi:hypothetical protein